MNTDSGATAKLAQEIARTDSAGPSATDSAGQEASAASQDVKPGKTERNLSVADQLQFSVETTKDDAEHGEADDARPQRNIGTATATTVDRVAALSSGNSSPDAEAVWHSEDSEECEDEADDDDNDDNDESDYSSEGEAFCTEIIVRMKNARNAMHLSARRGVVESGSAHAAEEGRLPSERPASSNVISQLLAANEDVPPQSERVEEFEFGRPSSGIAVHASSAETDLRYRDSGEVAAVEELASVVHGVSDELRSLLLDDSEGDLAIRTGAGGAGERGAKPKETRPFQRAKRRQRQNVADSIAQCSAPGTHPPRNTARENALSEGDNRDVRQNEQEQDQKKVNGGVQTSSVLGEGGTRRAPRRPRKRVLEDDSDTDDELSDSDTDDWVRRTTSRARLGEYKVADDADYQAEVAGDVVVERACAATKMDEGRVIEQRPVEEGGASGDGRRATGQETGGRRQGLFPK
ncbi:hypothetical protein MTO96_029448 [Rhipicephalus appendiculatus]